MKKLYCLLILLFFVSNINAASVETEPNNEKENANEVLPNETLLANQSTGTDEDWFYFTSIGDDVLTITTTVGKNIEIVDIEGNLIHSGYINRDETKVGIKNAGTYYIKISYSSYLNSYELLIKLDSTPPLSSISSASDSAIEIVQKAYLSYYGRPGDPGGIDYWALRLDEAGGSWSTGILEAFGNSDEFINRFGNLSTTELITNIYLQLFNRSPDEGGLAYFTDLLSSLKTSLSQISVDILNGAAGEDAEIIKNKLLVSEYFVQKVAAGRIQYDSSSIEEAKNILASVNTEEDSVESAYKQINLLTETTAARLKRIENN